jgi:hypothetical protein
MTRTYPVSKRKLYIEELERPTLAYGQVATLACGEQADGGAVG